MKDSGISHPGLSKRMKRFYDVTDKIDNITCFCMQFHFVCSSLERSKHFIDQVEQVLPFLSHHIKPCIQIFEMLKIESAGPCPE